MILYDYMEKVLHTGKKVARHSRKRVYDLMGFLLISPLKPSLTISKNQFSNFI